jgi:hypothetical protein
MSSLQQVVTRVGIENVVDWIKLSNQPLQDDEITALIDKLDIMVVSKTQALSPAVVAEHASRLDFYSMSTNKNLPVETIEANLDKFDMRLSQEHHKYNDDIMMKLIRAGCAETLVLLTYQKPSLTTIYALFEPHVTANQWTIVRNMADTATKHQQLTQEFYDYLIDFETGGFVPDSFEMFDRAALFKHQTQLSREWLERNIVKTAETRRLFLANQKLPDDVVLNYIVQYPDEFNMAEILTKQRLREEIIQYCLELTPKDKYRNLLLVAEYQTFDIAFLQRQIATAQLSHEDAGTVYNTVYLRTLNPSSPTYIAWSPDTIAEFVTPHTDLPRLIQHDLSAVATDFVKAIVARGLMHQISWYDFIHNQRMTREMVDLLKILGIPALERWCAEYKFARSLPDPERKDELKRIQRWWASAPVDSATLIAIINYAPEETDPDSQRIGRILREYISATDWVDLLNHYTIPEPLIELFANFKKPIEARMHNISYWWKIGRYQKLSSEFILKHFDKFDLSNLLINQSMTREMLDRAGPFMTDEQRQLASQYQQ